MIHGSESRKPAQNSSVNREWWGKKIAVQIIKKLE
jgi:hypothetical protein